LLAKPFCDVDTAARKATIAPPMKSISRQPCKEREKKAARNWKKRAGKQDAVHCTWPTRQARRGLSHGPGPHREAECESAAVTAPAAILPALLRKLNLRMQHSVVNTE